MKKINHVEDDSDIHLGIYRQARDWLARNPGKRPFGGTYHPLEDVAAFADARIREIEGGQALSFAEIKLKARAGLNPFGF